MFFFRFFFRFFFIIYFFLWFFFDFFWLFDNLFMVFFIWFLFMIFLVKKLGFFFNVLNILFFFREFFFDEVSNFNNGLFHVLVHFVDGFDQLFYKSDERLKKVWRHIIFGMSRIDDNIHWFFYVEVLQSQKFKQINQVLNLIIVFWVYI